MTNTNNGKNREKRGSIEVDLSGEKPSKSSREVTQERDEYIKKVDEAIERKEREIEAADSYTRTILEKELDLIKKRKNDHVESFKERIKWAEGREKIGT